ncbi:GAF domain-containing protein [Flavobacterium foetidum]|uniref:GAF domain-containing protein n=1 Tax=Flavobacterium foetidum TaxID=2026681 RepID=UPI001074C101|nr:GAF domain-containing protein [Flavobacterium foetidum]KAF2517266.1 GAF domain-containing protein [Flavobacterium foetidum]
MDIQFFKESPFTTIISFHKLIESFEEIALSDIDYRSNYAKAILNQIDLIPELRTGIYDYSVIKENEALIKNIVADLFPTALTHNEIKAITIPFQNISFNYTERFKKILRNAGDEFYMEIRDFSDHQFYINNCCLILSYYYKQHVDFNQPFFYDIPDENGVEKHYRILYNADFMEIIPTENAVSLTQEDIDQLLDNYNDIDLWKSKFPKGSWILRGFGIVSLFDATTESAISTLKSNLLKPSSSKLDSNDILVNIFKSIFNLPNLKVGFIIYNPEEEKFIRPIKFDEQIASFLLHSTQEVDCKNAFFGCSFENLLDKKEPFVISNVKKFIEESPNKNLGEHLLRQGIQSCVFAPVTKDGQLLGVIELVSENPRDLNTVNATKLDLVLPYLTDTIDRYNTDMQHQVEAIIQREYTTIHPSVYWKFKKESQNYFQNNDPSKDYIFKEIVFKNVFPLYGQIDIKGSSEHRNETVRKDLKNQLTTILNIFENQKPNSSLMLLEQRKFELESLRDELDQPLKADTEQHIQRYIEDEIHPILKNTKDTSTNQKLEEEYFESLDEKTGMFYQERKKFDNAMSIINKKLASVLDKKQLEAQQIYPHYYERFKTDGVEHNLYIGASIAPTKPFDIMYLHNLRLWQLQTLCEMELEHHQLKESLPYELDVTSLILVFSSALSIRFRMDEKRFDVDGTYNARYEVVKKRIDKAHIKGSSERITEKEKITIVYSQNSEEAEYLKYIKYLQHKKILEPAIEQFEVEDLQGVSGLRAIRVKVINNTSNSAAKKITYQDLLDELN